MWYLKVRDASIALLGPFLPLPAEINNSSSLISKLLIRIHRFNYLWIDVFAIIYVVKTPLRKLTLFVFLLNWFLCLFGVHIAYHRYFSHRSFKTGRIFQFTLAWIGASACQSGPLWWSSLHRNHHRYSDKDRDHHSPVGHGLFYAHLGWLLNPRNFKVDMEQVKDLTKFPELCWLEKFLFLPPLTLALALYLSGSVAKSYFPNCVNSPSDMIVWGFLMSVFASRQCTFLINSISHSYGAKDFITSDESRNSFLVSLLTLGSGWHNNHHAYPNSARYGFYWWQIDTGYYLLKLLEAFGLIWNLKPIPKKAFMSKTLYRSGIKGD